MGVGNPSAPPVCPSVCNLVNNYTTVSTLYTSLNLFGTISVYVVSVFSKVKVTQRNSEKLEELMSAAQLYKDKVVNMC